MPCTVLCGSTPRSSLLQPHSHLESEVGLAWDTAAHAFRDQWGTFCSFSNSVQGKMRFPSKSHHGKYLKTWGGQILSTPKCCWPGSTKRSKLHGLFIREADLPLLSSMPGQGQCLPSYLAMPRLGAGQNLCRGRLPHPTGPLRRDSAAAAQEERPLAPSTRWGRHALRPTKEGYSGRPAAATSPCPPSSTTSVCHTAPSWVRACPLTSGGSETLLSTCWAGRCAKQEQPPSAWQPGKGTEKVFICAKPPFREHPIREASIATN